MRKAIRLALIIGSAFALILGCSDDIVLESESDLKGNFLGTYTIIENYGSTSQEEHSQPIIWTFADSTYIMRIDTTQEYDRDYSICRVDGRYSLTEGVNFVELHSLPDPFTSCKDNLNPRDLFTLVKSNNADTLRMTQYDGVEQLQKEIYVIRTASTSE